MILSKKMFFSAVALFLGIAMVSDQAVAQKSSTAQLLGKVVEANTQKPVSGASVKLKEMDKKATTDERGMYTFNSLKPDTYTVSVTADGYKKWEQEVEVSEKGKALTIQLEPEGN